MLSTAEPAYGVADPAEVRQLSGREFLQAMMDGRLPAPAIAKTMSFRLAEIGDVHRFKTAAQLCCWAGLTPRQAGHS